MTIGNESARWRQPTGADDVPKFLSRKNTTCLASAQEDSEREQRIDVLRLQLLAAVGPDARRAGWIALRDEIARRSPAAIEHLERARGLRL